MLLIDNCQARLLFGAALGVAALWFGIRPTGAQSTDSLFDYQQTMLNGPVSATVDVPLLESCRSLCSTRSGCAGFDYSPSDQMCRLFSIVVSAGDSPIHRAGTRGLIAGYRSPTNPPAAPTPSAEAKKQNNEPKALAEKKAANNAAQAAKPAPHIRAGQPKPARKAKPTSAAPSVAEREKRAKKLYKICQTVRGRFQIPANEYCSPGL